MTDNYYYHVNNLGLKGVEELVKIGNPDFVPYADAFILRYHAPRVDFIEGSRLNSLSGWLMTEKMLDVLLCFRLPEHNIYDAWVEHRKKRYPYKILHFLSSYEKFVDFQKSSFYIVNTLRSEAKQRIYISDEIEYHLERNKLTQFNGIKSHKLYLVDEHLIAIDVLNFRYVGSGIFIKQNIVDALKANSITGIDFKPVGIPLYRHLTWADTGALVEECHCDYCESQQNKS